MKANEIDEIINNVLTEEIKRYIMVEGKKQVFHIKCDDQFIDTYDTQDEAQEVIDKLKKDPKLGDKQLIIEPAIYESYDDMIDKLDEMGEQQEINENMKNKKRTIVVTEAQVKKIISSTLNEDVPGIEATKKAQTQSKKDAGAYYDEVETKITKAMSFDGNDHPEFPKPIGKGEKKAIYNTDEENEYVEDYRGGGMQDVKTDEDPGKEYKDRQKKAIEGDTTMGNSQDAANVVKSDLGKKIIKNAERKAKKIEKDPMYVKDPQPVINVSKDKINEEMLKMKKIINYNERTQ